jgi:hypothetical protein
VKTEILENRRLDKPSFPWNNGGALRLWSLDDMLKAFRIYDFDKLLTDLRELQDELDDRMGETAPCDKVRPYWERYALKAQEILDEVAEIADALGLKPSYQRAIRTSVLAGEEDISLVDLHARIRDMREVLEDEIRCKLFLYLPPFSELYFGKTALFGDEVAEAFRLCKLDLEAAGNCYALELYTASVFHLMRVLEHGLRALAHYVGASSNPDNWGHIIDQIEKKIKELDKQPKSQERDDRIKFCAEAAIQLTYFKDAWRNHVMHGGDFYLEPKATQIMEHVRDFMRHLSTRLSF